MLQLTLGCMFLCESVSVFIFSRHTPRSRIPGLCSSSIFSFLYSSSIFSFLLFPIVAAPIYIHKGSFCPPSCQHLSFFCLFDNNCFNRYEVIAHCCLICISLLSNVEPFSCTYWPSTHLWKMSIQIFYSFFNQTAWFFAIEL